MSQGETVFKKRVLRDLKKLGHRVYVLKTQERSRRGVPDLLICANGTFIAIELKVPGEEPTMLQSQRLRTIREAGGYAFWTDPIDWDKHLEFIKNWAR